MCNETVAGECERIEMMCDDLLTCMLGVLTMLVMVMSVPLLLYWLWFGLTG